MRQGTVRRIVAMAAAGVVTLGAVVAQGGYSPQITRAQSSATTGQPINICGTVTAFVASSQTAAGSITFFENNVSTTIAIPSNLAFGGVGPSVVGTDQCLSGILNSSGQLTNGHIQQNVSQSTTTCGAVVYTPPASGQLGELSIGGTIFPVALGTAFTGTALTTNTNLCVALTLNGLGQITAGVAQSNNGATQSFTPVALCGVVTAYTAATASVAGTISFRVGNATNTYGLAPGSASIGTGSITVGQDLCFVGVLATGNTIGATAVFSTDITTSVVTCGAVNGYTAASSGSLGVLTLGTTTFTIGYGVAPTGDLFVTSAPTCITATLNGLGQIVTLSAQVIQGTATPTVN